METSAVTRIIRVSIAVLGLISLAAGLWAMLAPHAFFESAAHFEPYNRHFIHDIGAFQIGLGMCFEASLLFRDGLMIVLVGNACAAVAHFVGHVADRSLGGNAGDPYTFGGLALVMVALALARSRTRPTA